MTKTGREELHAAIISLLRNPNLSMTDIARHLNTSTSTVNRIQHLYCPERRADRFHSGPDKTAKAVQERRETVGRLLREGLSIGEIACQLDVDSATVWSIQKKHYPEIEPQRKKPNPPRWLK